MHYQSHIRVKIDDMSWVMMTNRWNRGKKEGVLCRSDSGRICGIVVTHFLMDFNKLEVHGVGHSRAVLIAFDLLIRENTCADIEPTCYY